MDDHRYDGAVDGAFMHPPKPSETACTLVASPSQSGMKMPCASGRTGDAAYRCYPGGGRSYMDEMILQGTDVLFVGQLEQKTSAVVYALLGRMVFSPRLVLAGHGRHFLGNGQTGLTQRVSIDAL